MIKMKILVFALLIVFGGVVYAQSATEIQNVGQVIDDYYYVFNLNQEWTRGRSSVLHENGKPNDAYELSKISDEKTDTAWVEGVKGDGIGEFVYSHVIKGEIGYDDFPKNSMQITITIVNGFCKSEKLFIANNRVKKAEIKLYDVALRVGQNDTGRYNEPAFDGTKIIELKDTMEPQTFTITITPRNTLGYGYLSCFLKFTILDVYKGTKYQDTAISELNATANLIPNSDNAITSSQEIH
jgi:hypothetical protein